MPEIAQELTLWQNPEVILPMMLRITFVPHIDANDARYFGNVLCRFAGKLHGRLPTTSEVRSIL